MDRHPAIETPTTCDKMFHIEPVQNANRYLPSSLLLSDRPQRAHEAFISESSVGRLLSESSAYDLHF